MQTRRRFKQSIPLKERLDNFAREAREKATTVAGAERDRLLHLARMADTAASIEDWANSHGLRPPE